MTKFAKRPLPCPVVFALEDGEIQTIEGKVKYKSGDAIMTGSAGEQWPISRATFKSTYTPCDGQQMGLDGMYAKNLMGVNARQIEYSTSVELGQQKGTLAARPGDWIITDPDGNQWVVANKIFLATYEPI